MSDELVEHIKKDLKKHGFPLEIEISHLLRNSGWNVTSRYSFVDEETAKMREVDCAAMKGTSTSERTDIDRDFRTSMKKNLNGLRVSARSTYP